MRRPVLLGLAAGVLLTAGLPPFGWWPLALGGAALLLHASDGLDVRGRAAIGLASGVGLLAPGLWWMTEFSLPGWALAMLLEAAMVALGVVAVPPGRWRWAAFPAALLLVDMARGRWPWGGVPIATIGDTQIGGLLLPAARLGGGLLLTALVGLAAVAVVEARQRRWLAIGAAASVAVATLAGAVAPDGTRTGSLRVALVQGGGDRGTRAIHTSEAAVFRAHVATTARVPDGVELILWPEDVVDVDEPVLRTPEGATLAALAERHGATLVAGIVAGGDGTTFYNTAQAWLPDGRPGPAYEKNHRVPFGEFIPFRSLVDKVADISAVPRDAHAGDGPGILPTPAGRLGVVISFEVFFARRARDAMTGHAEVLLVPTNASSYSSTQMPALELAAARLRAVETGRDVLQAAPTGFSAVIDRHGDVRRHTDLGRRDVLTTTVDRRRGDTPYTRLGDGPFVAAAVIVLAGAWLLSRRSSST